MGEGVVDDTARLAAQSILRRLADLSSRRCEKTFSAAIATRSGVTNVA